MTDDDQAEWLLDVRQLTDRGLSRRDAENIIDMRQERAAREQEAALADLFSGEGDLDMPAREWSELMVENAKLNLAREWPRYFPDVTII